MFPIDQRVTGPRPDREPTFDRDEPLPDPGVQVRKALDRARKREAQLEAARIAADREADAARESGDAAVVAAAASRALGATEELSRHRLRVRELEQQVVALYAAEARSVSFLTRMTPRANRGRRCSVCHHPERATIEAALVLGPLLFEQRKRLRLKPAQLERHWAAHMEEVREQARHELPPGLQLDGPPPILTVRQSRILMRKVCAISRGVGCDVPATDCPHSVAEFFA